MKTILLGNNSNVFIIMILFKYFGQNLMIFSPHLEIIT